MTDLYYLLWLRLAERRLVRLQARWWDVLLEEVRLLLLLLVRDRLMHVIDETAHRNIPRVVHPDLLRIGRWLGYVKGRKLLYLWQLRLEAEDVTILVLIFAIFIVRQADIIYRTIHTADFSVLLLRYSAGLCLLLAIGTLQKHSFFIELILEESAGRLQDIRHASSLRTILLEDSFEVIRPLIKCHIRVKLRVARLFARFLIGTA